MNSMSPYPTANSPYPAAHLPTWNPVQLQVPANLLGPGTYQRSSSLAKKHRLRSSEPIIISNINAGWKPDQQTNRPTPLTPTAPLPSFPQAVSPMIGNHTPTSPVPMSAEAPSCHTYFPDHYMDPGQICYHGTGYASSHLDSSYTRGNLYMPGAGASRLSHMHSMDSPAPPPVPYYNRVEPQEVQTGPSAVPPVSPADHHLAYRVGGGSSGQGPIKTDQLSPGPALAAGSDFQSEFPLCTVPPPEVLNAPVHRIRRVPQTLTLTPPPQSKKRPAATTASEFSPSLYKKFRLNTEEPQSPLESLESQQTAVMHSRGFSLQHMMPGEPCLQDESPQKFYQNSLGHPVQPAAWNVGVTTPQNSPLNSNSSSLMVSPCSSNEAPVFDGMVPQAASDLADLEGFVKDFNPHTPCSEEDLENLLGSASATPDSGASPIENVCGSLASSNNSFMTPIQDSDSSVTLCKESDPSVTLYKESDPSVTLYKELDTSVTFYKNSDPKVTLNKDCDSSVTLNKDTDHSLTLNEDCDLNVTLNKDCDPSVILNKDSGPSVTLNKDSGPSKGISCNLSSSKKKSSRFTYGVKTAPSLTSDIETVTSGKVKKHSSLPSSTKRSGSATSSRKKSSHLLYGKKTTPRLTSREVSLALTGSESLTSGKEILTSGKESLTSGKETLTLSKESLTSGKNVIANLTSYKKKKKKNNSTVIDGQTSASRSSVWMKMRRQFSNAAGFRAGRSSSVPVCGSTPTADVPASPTSCPSTPFFGMDMEVGSFKVRRKACLGSV